MPGNIRNSDLLQHVNQPSTQIKFKLKYKSKRGFKYKCKIKCKQGKFQITNHKFQTGPVPCQGEPMQNSITPR